MIHSNTFLFDYLNKQDPDDIFKTTTFKLAVLTSGMYMKHSIEPSLTVETGNVCINY